MDWDDYSERYEDFRKTNLKTRVLLQAASEAFQDYPIRLPEKVRQIDRMVQSGFRKGILELFAEAGGPDDDASVSMDVPIADAVSEEEKLHPWEHFAMNTLSLSHLSDDEPNFERVICAQSLVMLLAQVEAFLGDSIRAACYEEPRLLKREREVTWKEVIEAQDRDTVIATLTESYADELTDGPLDDTVSSMESQFGLDLEVEGELAHLRHAADKRHIIIHNGGRVDKKYLAHSSGEGEDLELGQKVPLEPMSVEKVGMSANIFCGAVFNAVAEKFFDVEDTPEVRTAHFGDGTIEF